MEIIGFWRVDTSKRVYTGVRGFVTVNIGYCIQVREGEPLARVYLGECEAEVDDEAAVGRCQQGQGLQQPHLGEGDIVRVYCLAHVGARSGFSSCWGRAKPVRVIVKV